MPLIGALVSGGIAGRGNRPQPAFPRQRLDVPVYRRDSQSRMLALRRLQDLLRRQRSFGSGNSLANHRLLARVSLVRVVQYSMPPAPKIASCIEPLSLSCTARPAPPAAAIMVILPRLLDITNDISISISICLPLNCRCLANTGGISSLNHRASRPRGVFSSQSTHRLDKLIALFLTPQRFSRIIKRTAYEAYGQTLESSRQPDVPGARLLHDG